MKRLTAIFLAAILFCGLFTACGTKDGSQEEGNSDPETSGPAELILTDWLRYLSAEEEMYADLGWALSHMEAFCQQPEWGSLLTARAAVELAAKRTELREEPDWDAPEDAYSHFEDSGADLSFVQPTLAGFENDRETMRNTLQLLRQYLMGDVFTQDGLSRTADAVMIYKDERRVSMIYLALTTDYLLLELDDEEQRESFYESMAEYSPEILASRTGDETTEELENKVAEVLDVLDEIISELSVLTGRGQAELDLLREYLALGDMDSIIAMYGTIEGLPGLLPDPGWNLTEAVYYWTEEDESRRYLTKKEDLTSPPEHCVMKFAEVTEDETEQYLSYLESLGLSGVRSDGEDGDYDVYFSIGGSIFTISRIEDETDIYMLENPVCLAPEWYIIANMS